MAEYAFPMDSDPDDRRLGAAERQFDVVTRAVLTEVGVRGGWRCWEVGAGHGSIVRWLSSRVGAGGEVLATDLTPEALPRDLPSWVSVRRHDVASDPAPGSGFDLVHARLVLEHLADPEATMVGLVDCLTVGGWLVVEDSVDLLFASSPPESAFAALAPVWESAARSVGWDPGYGLRLLTDMRRSGLQEIEGRTWRAHAAGGFAWSAAVTGLDLLDGRAMPDTVADVVSRARRRLGEPESLITGGAVMSAWGRKPAR